MDVKADTRSTFWNNRERYQKAGFRSVAEHAKGRDLSTIRAGLFDLDTMLDQN